MRIGLIAPPWVSVPPLGYGGTEVVIDNLARGLHDRGHDVRLFMIGDSTCPVQRDFLYEAPRVPMGTSVDEAAHVLAAYDALADVDLIHDHTILGPLLAARAGLRRPPVVSTHHGAFTLENRRIFAAIAQHAAVVAISHDQASHAPDVPVAAVIHHGIDLDVYRPGSGDGGYLLFLGRMSPDKGVDLAIRAARAAGRPLVLACKIREPAERTYFEQVVQPLLGSDDDLRIEPAIDEQLDLLRGAVALVNPISWDEPFGLVMVEALATGTPVLAFARGAAPEIIEHGRTGYFCSNEADLITAIGNAPLLDRRRCRAAAEKRFSLQHMVSNYEALYGRVLGHPSATLRPRQTVTHIRHRQPGIASSPAVLG